MVIEKGKDCGYWAYVSDLPRCTSFCGSFGDAERNVKGAVDLQIESLREHGEPVPPPTTGVTTVDAA